jgi:hypothetical protein
VKSLPFSIDEYNGYVAGERYTKRLVFKRMYGNSKTRYIILNDEDGNEMLWTTNDYTQTFKNFQKNAIYRFTIEYIINADKQILISRLQLPKEAIIVK